MYQRELDIAIDLARQASDIAMEIYARDFSHVEKANDAGPVTEADLRINEFLVNALREAFPEDAVIGEESPAEELASSARRRWIIDPIDGTKDFLQKNGEFSVMIGLAVDGRAELGVVAVPAHRQIYAGAPGHGAFMLDEHGTRTTLRVNTAIAAQDATIVNSRNHPDATIDFIRDEIGITREYRHGSVGCKVAHISEGRADLYVNLSGKCHWWDVAGPEAIVREAGGVVLTLEGGELRYTGTSTRIAEPFFASNAAISEAVMGAAKRALASH